MFKNLLTYLIMSFSMSVVYAQSVSGKVFSKEDATPIPFASVFVSGTNFNTQTNENGYFELKNIPLGTKKIGVTIIGYKTQYKTILIQKSAIKVDFELEIDAKELREINAQAEKETTNGLTRLNEVEGTAIYAGRKSEVIVMSDITANTATNNARQVFSKIAGLNVWESDGAGLQLGIAARGLNPNRTSGFNTRMNGYDMSADAIGYPESYYTPPTEALEKVEVVRGAASLQYGTQFGGMLNFVKKKGSDTTKAEVVSRQTVGSFGFLNSFNSVGGTIKKINYYTYIQHKQGNGWRENSGFNLNSIYTNINYKASARLIFSFDITLMNYLAQQPGGLTDIMFENNPRQSIRERNWFMVNWNLASASVDYYFSENTRLNSKTFGLIASRDAVGFLGTINRIDPNEERDLLSDKYQNIGNETRLIHNYKIGEQTNNFLIGARLYKGYLDRKQGLASANSDADFSYLNNTPDGSSYVFPSKNLALFVENIFRITPNLSLTPGLRFEYIFTSSDGYFNQFYKDLAGNILEFKKVEEKNKNSRTFPLFGIGLGYFLSKKVELYSNFSQNYRAITFNDMRVNNPSLKVDTNLTDEKGFNADLGLRGKIKNVFSFDATLYYLSYNQRIGTVQLIDPVRFTAYRLRTNVSDARTIGLESFMELEVLKVIHKETKNRSLSLFSNLSLLDARYINSEEPAYQGKKVELVPNLIMKYGLTYKNQRKLSVSYNFAYTSSQFTDATNAIYTANAVNGVIQSYFVMDLSFKKTIGKFALEGGCNNLTNNMYFTRRADGYPGPGIIPSDGRNFYAAVQLKF